MDLREASDVLEALGLRWLDEEEREQTRELWRSTWNQVPYDEGFHAACAARIERSVPLFEGPARHRRLGRAGSRLVVAHDPEQDDVVWLSLSHAMPPLAWAVGGPGIDELGRAVRAYTQAGAPRAIELPRRERIVKQITVDGIETIKNAIEGLELWVDDAAWASAYLDDPWRDLDPDAGMMMLSLHMKRVLEQHPGRHPSLSFRTLWSNSIVTVEQHPFDLWVFDVRFRPFDDRRALELLGGAEPGSRLPPDLPVDVAASLLRGNSTTRESVQLKAKHGLELFDVAALCAMEPGEATTVARLRERMAAWREDERFGGLTEVLDAYRYSALLFEAAATAPDPELAESLRGLLAPASDEAEVAS